MTQGFQKTMLTKFSMRFWRPFWILKNGVFKHQNFQLEGFFLSLLIQIHLYNPHFQSKGRAPPPPPLPPVPPWPGAQMRKGATKSDWVLNFGLYEIFNRFINLIHLLHTYRILQNTHKLKKKKSLLGVACFARCPTNTTITGLRRLEKSPERRHCKQNFGVQGPCFGGPSPLAQRCLL